MSVTHQYPSLLRRFACVNYDLLLLIAVSIAYGLIYLGLAKLIFGMTTDRATGPLFQLGWLLTIMGFYCYFWIRGGQTTGMRAWRLKVINLNGQAASLKQAIMRCCLAPIGWLLFFTCFFDEQKQCLHDRWSQTQLILIEKEKKK